MFVTPLSMEKYRTPFAVVFLTPGDDQLNKSCGHKSRWLAALKCEANPMTSSISCCVKRWASKLFAFTGRVNWYGAEALSVTMPSYGPPSVPCPDSSGGVFSPMERPAALEALMLGDNAVTGKLASAVASLLVFASARRAFM